MRLQLIGKSLRSDVLAGKQGSSCKTLHPTPALKLVHIRFVARTVSFNNERVCTGTDYLGTSTSQVKISLPAILRKEDVEKKTCTVALTVRAKTCHLRIPY